MDAVRIYEEFKRIAFSNGYWTCYPTIYERDVFAFNAAVIPPYTAPCKFGIFCGDELINHSVIEPDPAFGAVLDRPNLRQYGWHSVSFRIEAAAKIGNGAITCRDLQTGNQIGAPYYIPGPDYEIETTAKSVNMLRSNRSADGHYIRFVGYDDCVKLTKIIEQHHRSAGRLKVLDWGVGSGRVSLHMCKNSAFEMFGTDIDPVNMKHLHETGFPPSRFMLTDPGADIPFDDGTFDACFGLSVFTHLTEELQNKYLAETSRILKPGGISIFSVHGLMHFFARMNDGNVFFKLIDNGLLVIGDNFDITENFSAANDKKLYVDTMHTPDYILSTWSKFFSRIQIIQAPTAYTHDLVVCRK
jgi:SAM-dependent methyltransferase